MQVFVTYSSLFNTRIICSLFRSKLSLSKTHSNRMQSIAKIWMQGQNILYYYIDEFCSFLLFVYSLNLSYMYTMYFASITKWLYKILKPKINIHGGMLFIRNIQLSFTTCRAGIIWKWTKYHMISCLGVIWDCQSWVE